MDIAKALKELRIEQGLTQTALAKKANLAPSCIAMIETGKREPTSTTLHNLAIALNVSVDYLMGLEDDFGVKTTAASAADNFTAEERQFIEDFRSLNAPGKKLVKDVIKNLQAGSRAATSTENKTDKADKRA